jgi:sugar lactone lactonase YvrE
MDISCVLPIEAQLGEGPVWCEREQVLWWVDIRAPAVNRFNPALGTNTAFAMPEPVGCLGLGQDGRILAALASGLSWLDPADGSLAAFTPIEADEARTRLNDGRVDHQGRLWVGSMNRTPDGPGGALYCATADGGLRLIESGIKVPNCTAFSPDGRTMYFTDTPTRRIRAFDLDPATGALANERTFAQIADSEGAPDGGTVDAEGHLWVAQWDGSQLSRFRPDGSRERVVPLPVRRPTCMAFGGADFDTLYVTSARTGLAEPGPYDGGVLAFKPGVRGLPEARFGR